MLGLPLDVKPTPELRAAQRSFFALLYRLLVGRDTGPRLPTLLLAIGAERVRALLSLPERILRALSREFRAMRMRWSRES